MASTLISYDALKAKGITFSKCHLWRLERDGKFPKRVPISARRHGWFEHEIDAFIVARGAVRDIRQAA